MRSKSTTRTDKIELTGRITAVQPRIRLMRSFDQRHHGYHGFVLRMKGTCGDENGEFQIAVGKAAQAKHRFRAGMEASGLAVPVPDPRLDTAGFYKASSLKVVKDAEGKPSLVRRSSECQPIWKPIEAGATRSAGGVVIACL